MNQRMRRALTICIATTVIAMGGFVSATLYSLRDFPDGLDIDRGGIAKPTVLARDGTRLSVSLGNVWNDTDRMPLEAIPDFLKLSFIESEDQHFYTHRGVDWDARWAAAWQDAKRGAAVRGASTITEQVVRMLHARPRTVWSRWLEGLEAHRLESKASKQQILAFYLNQVPYAYRRRGVVQAAHVYFNRDLETLSRQEMLALVVLVRSPNGMDLRHNAPRANQAMGQLADRLVAIGELSVADRELMRTVPLELKDSALPLDAGYFVSQVLHCVAPSANHTMGVTTTLDPYLQASVQQVLDTALTSLAKRKVHDGGVLVIDHSRNEILAWVVGHAHANGDSTDTGLGYDTVLTPRQPGSTMKPLLYAMALEKGWTAATLINDNELSEAVGGGQHTFHNYSHVHYGPIRLREALGNSLNIPAVRTLKYVGTAPFLERLHALGISSLQQHPDFYGDGLALGNGEVTLYEMAQAYTALARGGNFVPLTFTPRGDSAAPAAQAVYSPEVSTLIANILSDPDARSLEFGAGLQFPVQTAIKTGTSSDYHDAWAIGFDYAHTVAVWMGNLTDVPMDGVTGSVGPAMVLRSVFAQLNRNQDTRGLSLSRKLVAMDICRTDGRPADGRCASVPEWFLPATTPTQESATRRPIADYRVLEPTPGLQLARDPRIPNELQAFTMSVAPVAGLQDVTWYVDGAAASTTSAGKFTWPLVRGTHEMYAVIRSDGLQSPRTTESVRFYVR